MTKKITPLLFFVAALLFFVAGIIGYVNDGVFDMKFALLGLIFIGVAVMIRRMSVPKGT